MDSVWSGTILEETTSADHITLGWILSKFYVEKAFSAEAKDFGDRIVSDIKSQFIEKLKEAKWMSKDVRKLGIEKGIFQQ